jgi:hypothetical protein
VRGTDYRRRLLRTGGEELSDLYSCPGLSTGPPLKNARFKSAAAGYTENLTACA